MGNAIRRDAVAIIVVALACGLGSGCSPFSLIHGWSIDALTALRWQMFGARRDPASTPVAVIAIDEETYETPPFKGSPAITWTPEIAQVLTAIIAGGAKVVGFDIVFPTSIEQSEIPFGDGTLGGRLRGFDRDFLRALALGAHAGKVVLGEAQHRDFPIMPAPGQRIAVGQGDNIRSLNVYNDPDDVVRRIPLSVVIDGTPQPSMAVELAARALGTAPMTISGYRIAPAVPNTIALNFDGGAK